VIGGGYGNTANGNFSTVNGGSSNLGSSTWATVGGGGSNAASGVASTVGGGYVNFARGDYTVVSGGGGGSSADSNSATGSNSTIGGGRANVASGTYATVAGGSANRASGGYSATVSGGASNIASGQDATVCGGYTNTASGNVSTVCGGTFNVAAGAYSFAAGRRAKANYDGCFRWADSYNADFSIPDTANSFSVRATGGVHLFTNATLTSGAHLYAGSSTWNAVSDSTLKRRYGKVDTKEVLDKVATLPIERWSYKAQDESVHHIGPMAQDFWRLFRVGDDSLSILTIDPDGIALAAIQELAKRNEKLEEQVARLTEQVQTLMAAEQHTSHKEK
ncbi:tail fiber domain-containing protein, partial [bacterium]|nr:tail fiber domain-containing protein [bacterium]